MAPPTHADYRVGWICPLEVEQHAAEEMLDEIHDSIPQPRTDNNVYTLGTINGHHVVIAGLPTTGNCSTATVVAHMQSTFPNIRYGLLVGIGGGVPCMVDGVMIRLGHVVVSKPTGTHSGAVHYDHGKAKQGKFERTGYLQPPPFALLNAAQKLAVARARAHEDPVWLNVQRIETKRRQYRKFRHPGVENDQLFPADCVHGDPELLCTDAGCDMARRIPQQSVMDDDEDEDERIVVHRGTIASGELLVRDAHLRDSLALGDKLLCFEMEAAGALTDFPCLVVRGISDYCDTHKNDVWHGYAAAVAAAYARQLFFHMPIEQETTSYRDDAVTAWIDRLPIANGAAFDSYEDEYATTCLPGTRTALLQEVSDWVRDPSSKSLFWLNGRAGTGKSTISRTVAGSFATDKLLAGSFFFKRGESDRGSVRKFFTTLAAELVIQQPAVGPYVRNALEKDPAIVRKTVREQFEKLIEKPLRESVTPATEQVLAFVIDALDECDREKDVKVIISLLSGLKTSVPSLRLKVFITSRPELHVRLGFKAIEGKYQDLILHEIHDSIVSHDIGVFWQYHLHKIRDEHNLTFIEEEERLPPDWPRESDIDSLTKMAFPLFIFAATACRLIADSRYGEPDQIAQELLESWRGNGSRVSDLTETYLPILTLMIDGMSEHDKADFIAGFCKIVGVIVILAEPLSRRAISRLLDLPSKSVARMLERLHSVLSVPSSPKSPVRLFHLSFRDFLVGRASATKKHPFTVHEPTTHEMLAGRCIEVMEAQLRQNILDLPVPGTRRWDIDPHVMDDKLPPELQYACLYWIHHLEAPQTAIIDGDRWSQFLMRHLLHWVEVLCLIGRAWEIPDQMRNLQSRLLIVKGSETQALLDDLTRLLIPNISLLDSTPLQLYSSLLIFAPTTSLTRRTFAHSIPKWIHEPPEVTHDWDPNLVVIEADGYRFLSGAFCHDSSIVATTSQNGIVHIWRAETGECLQAVRLAEANRNFNLAPLSFSHDSSLVAVAFGNVNDRRGRVDMCHTDTGGYYTSLEVQTDSHLESVVFSHDSDLLVSTSGHIVIIWKVETGQCIRTIRTNLDKVDAVTLSWDSSLLAPISLYNTEKFQIFNTHSGDCVYEENTVERYNSLRFISGTTKIACSVPGGVVEIWELQGNSMRRCESYSNPIIRSDGASLEVGLASELQIMAFFEQGVWFMSPDSRLIVRMDVGDVKVRRNGPELLQQDTDISYNFKNLLTSPDGRLIASIYSKKLRLWNSTTKEQLWEFAVVEGWSPECYFHNILKFSDDSQIIALALWNSEPIIWEAQSGRHCAKFPAHGIYPSLSGNSMMAASTVGSIINIWVLKPAPKLLCTYAGHDGEVSNVVFSNDDSQTVTSSSNDGVVMVWSLQSGKCMHRWQSGGTNVLGLAFSQESELIAACAGKYVRVWSVKSGKRLVTFNPPRGYAWLRRLDSIHFSPDAKFVVMSGTTDSFGFKQYFTILGVDSGEVEWESFHGTKGALRSFERSEDGTHYILTEIGAIAVLDSRAESPSEILEEADRVDGEAGETGRETDRPEGEVDPAEDGRVDTDGETDGETGRVDVQLIGYGLSTDRSWVLWNGMQLIWLPKRYRESNVMVHGSTIILGLISERLCLMRLSYGDLPTTGLSPAQLMEEPNTSRGGERAEAKTKSGRGPAASRIDLAAPF